MPMKAQTIFQTYNNVHYLLSHLLTYLLSHYLIITNAGEHEFQQWKSESLLFLSSQPYC